MRTVNEKEVVVTNDTVTRANAAVSGAKSVSSGNAAVIAVVPVAEEVVVTSGNTATVPTSRGDIVVKREPAKPGQFYDETHRHKKGHHRGPKNDRAVVATEQALLDDVARYRANLVGTIDELHTRLSPKYQIDQLKSTWTQAGTDALSILKNEGSPVDETRKKKAESILKAGGALAGLIGLHGLRKALKNAKSRRNVRKAVAKGLPPEHLELVGVVEGLDVENLRFEDATVEPLEVDFE